jgi:ATP-dependent Lon protease
LQIALQLVRQGVSNEPVQEAPTTASEEPTSSDSANVKDETLKDPAVEDAFLTSSTTEPAFEEAKEVKREGGTSEVSVILFDFDIFC